MEELIIESMRIPSQNATTGIVSFLPHCRSGTSRSGTFRCVLRFMSTLTEWSNLPALTRSSIWKLLTSSHRRMDLNLVHYWTPGSKYVQKEFFLIPAQRKRRVPGLEAAGSLPYSKYDRSSIEGEKLCIFGNGNAAWEMARASFDTALPVSVLGRRATRWNFVTKYSGDVRIKFAQSMENTSSRNSFHSPVQHSPAITLTT